MKWFVILTAVIPSMAGAQFNPAVKCNTEFMTDYHLEYGYGEQVIEEFSYESPLGNGPVAVQLWQDPKDYSWSLTIQLANDGVKCIAQEGTTEINPLAGRWIRDFLPERLIGSGGQSPL